eukprot:XP_004913953.1 PREDICTED: uncharacterized protein LOC101734421 [Xenopus tropicalis]
MSTKVLQYLPWNQLDQSQILCIINNFWMVLGFGILVGLSIIGGIISCLCKWYWLVSQRSSHTNTNVAVTNVIPQQPVMPLTGYQPVATQNMHVGYAAKNPPAYPGHENQTFMEYS